MSSWHAVLAATLAALLLYAALVIALILRGRREDARALAGFVPDCIVLFRRLLADDRVPRRSKLVLAALIAYLAMPIDIIPDFIPVAGQLDDAIIVALALRSILRASGPQLLHEHWPGPQASLYAINQLAYGNRRAPMSDQRAPLTQAQPADMPFPIGSGHDDARSTSPAALGFAQ